MATDPFTIALSRSFARRPAPQPRPRTMSATRPSHAAAPPKPAPPRFGGYLLSEIEAMRELPPELDRALGRKGRSAVRMLSGMCRGQRTQGQALATLLRRRRLLNLNAEPISTPTVDVIT